MLKDLFRAILSSKERIVGYPICVVDLTSSSHQVISHIEPRPTPLFQDVPLYSHHVANHRFSVPKRAFGL